MWEEMGRKYGRGETEDKDLRGRLAMMKGGECIVAVSKNTNG